MGEIGAWQDVVDADGLLPGVRAAREYADPADAGYLIVAVTARHTPAVNVSTGPVRSAVSRTSTVSAAATSTHSPPLEPE
jgi:hypothetical protein